MMGEQHFVHIPFFTESGGMTSILTLNNNQPEAATVTVTLFNSKGQPFVLPSITVAPELPARFEIGQLVAQEHGEVSSGNVQISFKGPSMGVTSQITVISAAHRLAFESVEDEAMDFSSSRLDGILWVAGEGTRAQIAMTNTSPDPLAVTILATNQRGDQDKEITLSSHATEVIEANEFLDNDRDGGSSVTLLSLVHSGSPRALMVTGFAVNEETGFSCNFPFVDRSTAVSTHLAGAHVRVGLANPMEGFPAGTRFSAPLCLANVGYQPTQMTVSADYAIDSVLRRSELVQVNLSPGETKEVDVALLLAEQGIIGPVDDAGIDVSYTGTPGTVIGRLTSLDQTRDFSFDVPVKDPLSGMMRVSGSYPWRLDNGYTTVLHLKNTVDKSVHALVQVRYDGGTYNLERIPLAPFQTIAVNIEALRDSQRKDIRGSVMPREITSGQVIWFEEDLGSLIGRAEVANIKAAIASSFSCGDTCSCPPSFKTLAVSPTGVTTLIGDQGQTFTAQETRQDCYGGTYGPYDRTSDSTWTSDNTNVATAGSSGSVTSVGGGTCNIFAALQCIVYIPSCVTNYVNAQSAGGVAVQVPTFVHIVAGEGNCVQTPCTELGFLNNNHIAGVLNIDYRVYDQNQNPINRSGIIVTETLNITTDGCGQRPTPATWTTDSTGTLTQSDRIDNCSNTCATGGSCTEAWDQFFVANHSLGLRIINTAGNVIGRKNSISTDCPDCPVFTLVQ
jgi:hypothetical protein